MTLKNRWGTGGDNIIWVPPKREPPMTLKEKESLEAWEKLIENMPHLKTNSDRYKEIWPNRLAKLEETGWEDRGVDGLLDESVCARYYHPRNRHWLRIFPGDRIGIFTKKRKKKRVLIREFSSWLEFIQQYSSLINKEHNNIASGDNRPRTATLAQTCKKKLLLKQ
jgi:hypothetical protein